MEYFMDYFFPSVVLFIAQMDLCLWGKNKYIRLIPTAIALIIATYHTGVLLDNLDNIWAAGMGIAYWALTALPPLSAICFGWMVYVVKLMIVEAKALKS